MPHLQLDPLVKEAIEAIQDGLLIMENDGKPLFANGPLKRHFRTFYEALENGATL